MGHGRIHFKNGLDSGLDISFYFLTLHWLRPLIVDAFENAKRFSWNKTSQELWGMAESILKTV